MKNGILEIDMFGNKHYYLEDKITLHRVGGPAVEYLDGSNFWWYDGKLHREDGPAYTNINYHDDGKRIIQWFYFVTKIKCSTQEEFERYLRLKAFW